MPLIWYEFGLIAAMFAGILALFVGLTFKLSRVRVQKWIGGAIGNFMLNLSKSAEEEGAVPGPMSSAGSPAFNLGGIKIDPGLIQLAVEYGPKLMELAKQFGLIKGGAGGAGGYIRP